MFRSFRRCKTPSCSCRSAARYAWATARRFAAFHAEPLEPRLHLAVITFDGGPLGTGTDFHNPANWDGDVLPGEFDDAVIPDLAGAPLITITQSITLNSLTADEAVRLSTGTLTLNSASLFNAAFTHQSGTLTGNGDCLMAGDFSWTAGTMSGTGITTLAASALSWSPFGSGTRTVNRPLLVERPMSFSGGTITGSAQINIRGDFHWSGGLMSGTGTTILEPGPTLTIINGTPSASRSLLVQREVLFTGGTLGGNGAMSLEADFTWTGGTLGTGAGQIQVLNGSVFHVSGPGSKTLHRHVQNYGEIEWTDSLVTVTGTITNHNLFNWQSGTIILDDGAVVNHGVLEVDTETEVSIGTITPSNSMTNHGTLRKLGAGTLSISHGGSDTFFTNNGIIELEGGGMLLDCVGASTGQLLSTSGTFLTIDGNFTYAATSLLQTAGLLTVSAGTHALPGGTFSATGSVLLSGGTITINDPISPVTIGLLGATVTFNAALGFDGALSITGGTVTFAQPQSFASLTASGGTLTGAGTVTITDSFQWGSTSLLGSGQTIVLAGASMSIVGGSRTLGRTLVLAGDTDWFSGEVTLNNGSIINNGTFRASSSTTLNFNHTNGSASFFNNGTVINGGEGSLRLADISVLSNSGVLTAEAGTIILGAGSNSGQIIGLAGTTIRLGSNFSHLPGSMLSVAGWLRFLGGTHVFPAGTIEATGVVDFSTGTITLNNSISPSSMGNFGAAATFNTQIDFSGDVTITGGTTTFTQPQMFSSLTLSAGTLAGAGNITVTGSMIWAGGNMTGSGQTILLPGSSFTLSGGDKPLERTLISSGAGVWTAGSLVLRNGVLINNGALAIDSATTLSVLVQAGSSSITNYGSITKAGSGTAFLGAMQGGSLVISNLGTVSAQAGLLIFPGLALTNMNSASHTLTGGEWIVAQGAALTLLDVQIRTIAADTGVSLAGTATFGALASLATISGSLVLENGAALSVNPNAANGTFSNAGSLHIGPGASLTVSGEYGQSPIANLNIGIAGIANEMMGRLVVTGLAALGGSLEIHYAGGFLPEQGDTLRFFSSSGTSEEFGSISVPPPPSLHLKSPVLMDSEGVLLIVTHIADWNNDLSVNVTDIFAFLGDWFAGTGDFNSDGNSSVSDIFAYLSAWFSAV